MTTQRLHWIDWSKALLIYLVVLAHYSNISPMVDNLICAFHMPAFFMISGYLHKPIAPSLSIAKNFKRLIVPALLFSLLCWGYYTGLMLIKHTPFSWDEYIYKPLLGIIRYDRPHVSPPCGVIWFLQVLFICQVVIDVFVRKGYKTLIALSLTCIVATAIWYGMGIDDKRNLFFLQRTCASLPFVILGFMAKEKNWLRRPSQTYWFPIILAVLYIVGVIYNGRVGIATWRFGHSAVLFFLIATIGCFSFFLFVNKIKNGGGKLLITISNGTIVILCLHRLMIPFFMHFHINAYIGSLLIVAVCYPLILFFNKYLPWFTGKAQNT